MPVFFGVFRIFIDILSLLIFIRVILSWVSPRPNTLTVILNRVTEPILSPVRRILPSTGPFDLSPMVVIIVLQVIGRFLT